MFDYYGSDELGFSGLLFCLQIFAVPLGSLILGGLAATLTHGLVALVWAGAREDAIAYLVFSTQGFLQGYVLQRRFPRILASGRWIWIPPVLFLLSGVVWDLRLGFASEIPDTFAPGLNGEARWAFVLSTMPALGSCFYSVGVAVAARVNSAAATPPISTR